MLCKICGVEETDNPDGVCDDCKFSMISNDDILLLFDLTIIL
jgi:NMD protein affecting ribosome stability and mRNA decay